MGCLSTRDKKSTNPAAAAKWALVVGTVKITQLITGRNTL
ncbi:MAG: hypothetical protein RL172_2771 [Bacteroidota bacterium]|jgi:hypothetical protein